MHTPTIRLSVIALAAALGATAAYMAPARSQVQATPSFVPIGVATTGNTSTAWFHEPSSRQALACQTVNTPNAGLSGIQCVSTKLP